MKEKILSIIQEYENLQKEGFNSQRAYLISKHWMDQFIEFGKLEGKDNFAMKPINSDIINDLKFNIIQYLDDTYNSFLKENLTLGKDFVYINEPIWLTLNSIFKGHKVKRYMNGEQQITKLLTFKLFPIYYNQINYLEGIQQFDSSWSLEQTVNKLEQALHNQLLLQVPTKNFVKLYILKKAYWDMSTLIEKIKSKSLEVEELHCNLSDLNEGQFIIMDIKLLQQDFVLQPNQQLEQNNQVNIEMSEFSRKGECIFEEQNKLLSCMLKCYECIDTLRNKVFAEQSERPFLKQILKESWYGVSECVLYDLQNYEFYEEKHVKIIEGRYDAVYIYKNENRVIINHQKNIREFIDKLLCHPQLSCNFESVLFECSNENYTEDIDFTLPTYTLKKGYKYQIRKLMNWEQNINNQDKIEIRVHRCTFENEGYPQYTNFEPIYRCFISKWAKYYDLHLLIANLFEEVNFDHYKENILDKRYKLQFQTDQQRSEKCSYCSQKLCNNCSVPFIDKQLNLNNKLITVYAVCNDAKPYVNEFRPVSLENYYLRDYFDVDWAHEQFLILNIDQEEIAPTKVRYYFDSYNYQLKGIIEKVKQNQYQCYCLMEQNKWFKFSNNQYQEVEQPSDCLDVVKLFYIRK